MMCVKKLKNCLFEILLVLVILEIIVSRWIRLTVMDVLELTPTNITGNGRNIPLTSTTALSFDISGTANNMGNKVGHVYNILTH